MKDDEQLRWNLRWALDRVHESETSNADSALVQAIEALAAKVFGADWRPLYDWEARNK